MVIEDPVPAFELDDFEPAITHSRGVCHECKRSCSNCLDIEKVVRNCLLSGPLRDRCCLLRVVLNTLLNQHSYLYKRGSMQASFWYTIKFRDLILNVSSLECVFGLRVPTIYLITYVTL